MRKGLAVLLKGLGYFWLVLCAVIWLVGVISIWRTHGFMKVQEMESPFNLIGILVKLVFVAPGMFFLWLSGKLQSVR